jgi:hypothetical protein
VGSVTQDEVDEQAAHAAAFDIYVEILKDFYEKLKTDGLLTDYKLTVDRPNLDIKSSVHLNRPIQFMKVNLIEMAPEVEYVEVNLMNECEE